MHTSERINSTLPATSACVRKRTICRWSARDLSTERLAAIGDHHLGPRLCHLLRDRARLIALESIARIGNAGVVARGANPAHLEGIIVMHPQFSSCGENRRFSVPRSEKAVLQPSWRSASDAVPPCHSSMSTLCKWGCMTISLSHLDSELDAQHESVCTYALNILLLFYASRGELETRPNMASARRA